MSVILCDMLQSLLNHLRSDVWIKIHINNAELHMMLNMIIYAFGHARDK